MLNTMPSKTGLVYPDRTKKHRAAAASAAKALKGINLKPVKRGLLMSKREAFKRRSWRMADFPNGNMLVLLADGKMLLVSGEVAYEVSVPFDALAKVFTIHVKSAWWKVQG